MIKAVIFDMDGLLINSEPFWRQAEVEIFKPLGLDISEDDCSETMGLRIDFAVKYWFDKFDFNGADIYKTSHEIVERVKELIEEKGKLMPGVYNVLNLLKDMEIPMAIASSSSMDLINSVVEKCNIADFFQILVSAEKEKYGKPHPSVFIRTAEKLEQNPMNCLVLEDSLSGVIAAKAALMKVVAVPSEIVKGEKGFLIADEIIDSLEEFNSDFLFL